MGHRVYFTTAMDLARKLTKAADGNRLHRELNALQLPQLLIIDEIGYLPFDAVQASLLFQVICRRYQKNQSLALTSNKAFGAWGQVFANDPDHGLGGAGPPAASLHGDQYPWRQLPLAREETSGATPDERSARR